MSISLNVSASPAIPDLPGLVTTIGDWLDRGTTLDDKIPVFIQMAEAVFNREIRDSQMERTVTGLVSGEDNNLPDDYLAMRAIYEEGSPDRPLKAVSPTAIRVISNGTAGTPVAYCLISGGIRLVPPPSSQILLTMDYYAMIPALSIVAPSNWLLQQHPDAYLYGTLYNAEAYLDNATRAAQWKSLLDETIAKINHASLSDAYGAGPLVPNGVVQVRGAKC